MRSVFGFRLIYTGQTQVQFWTNQFHLSKHTGVTWLQQDICGHAYSPWAKLRKFMWFWGYQKIHFAFYNACLWEISCGSINKWIIDLLKKIMLLNYIYIRQSWPTVYSIPKDNDNNNNNNSLFSFLYIIQHFVKCWKRKYLNNTRMSNSVSQIQTVPLGGHCSLKLM